MKTAISLPDELFEAGERAAEHMGLSRSELYRRALRAFLDQRRAAEITAALDEVYAAETEREPLDPVLEAMQGASIDPEEW